MHFDRAGSHKVTVRVLGSSWGTEFFLQLLRIKCHRAPLGGVAKRRPQTLSARRVDFEVILSDGSPDYQQNHFELILRNFPFDDFFAKKAIE